MTYKLWEVKVQIDKKPFSFDKVRQLAELDEDTATSVYEKGLKHPYLHQNVMWMCVSHEKQFGVPAKTYIFLEGYKWC